MADVEADVVVTRRSSLALLLAVALVLASLARVAARTQPHGDGVEVVGTFVVGAPITGAVLHEGYLYITTFDSILIYDTSESTAPRLIGAAVSPRPIYGELLSTNGEILLLNNGLADQTLDVWEVESKTNPVLVGSLNGVPDEHVSCVLDCSWAYGSEGSIVDLRSPSHPQKQEANWKDAVGVKPRVHRIDEYRHGFIFTAPRARLPQAIDVREPLHPRVIATTRMPRVQDNPFLYSYWTSRGDGRFVISSSETGPCNNENQGAMITFDTTGWPRDHRFEVRDIFRYPGRPGSGGDQCTAYYYSLHPDFDDGGLVLLPSGMSGVLIVGVSRVGHITELDSFVPPVSDVWLTFWADDEIFYALNTTGEVYILRYSA